MKRAAIGATGADWIGVREAAAIAGASVRAMQKRAARGSLTARKVERDGVTVWEFDARDLGASKVSNVDASIGANGSEVDAPKVSNHARNVAKVDAPNGANMDASIGQSGRTVDGDLNARLLAQLETENKFLRATVEQLQRDGAETRAALRAALKLTGDASAPQLTAARSGDAHNPTSATPEPPAKGAALTYGNIADELERSLGAN